MATLVKYVGPLVRVTVRASDGIEYTCPAGSSVSLPDDTAIALFAEGTFTAPDGSTPGFVPTSPVVYEEVFLANGVLSKNGTSSGSTVPVAVGGGISGATGGKLAVTDPSSPHGLIEGVATSLVAKETSSGAVATGQAAVKQADGTYAGVGQSFAATQNSALYANVIGSGYVLAQDQIVRALTPPSVSITNPQTWQASTGQPTPAADGHGGKLLTLVPNTTAGHTTPPGQANVQVRALGYGTPRIGNDQSQPYWVPGVNGAQASLNQPGGSFSFLHTGQMVLVRLWTRAGGFYRFRVDNQIVSSLTPVSVGSGSAFINVSLDFSASGTNEGIATRLITIECYHGAHLAAVAGDAGCSIEPPPPVVGPRLYMQGDSFWDGTADSLHGFEDMAHRLPAYLGIENYTIDALGGTGYLKTNDISIFPNYHDRLAANLAQLVEAPPDIIVIGGSINDGTGVVSPGAVLPPAAADMFATCRLYAPNAKIFCVTFGNFRQAGLGGQFQSGVLAANAAIAAACASDGNVFYLDMTNLLTGTGFTGTTTGIGNQDYMVASDRTHPTDIAHETYARVIARFIKDRLMPSAPVIITPQAPVDTVVPALSGVAQTGQILVSDTGTWNNVPTGFAYQWNRDATPISGATAGTYTLVSADETHAITCSVTASNATGSNTATSASVTAEPANTAPVNTVAPQVTGTTIVGQTLTCSNGTWTQSPTGFTFQWERDGTPISGATSGTYVLVSADATHSVSCTVTATNASGSTPQDSNSVAITAAPTVFVNDTFTGADTTLLTAHTGETGATWTAQGGTFTGVPVIDNADRIMAPTASTLILASGAPPTADYDVEADITWVTKPTGISVGVGGRCATGADTSYCAVFATTAGQWQLVKRLAGVQTTLGTFSPSSQPTVGSTSHVKLSLRGSVVSVVIDGTQHISVTDTDITAAGHTCVRMSGALGTETAGAHVDNFVATGA